MALVENRNKIDLKISTGLKNVDDVKNFSVMEYIAGLLFMFKKPKKLATESFESFSPRLRGKGNVNYLKRFTDFFDCVQLADCITELHGLVNSYNTALCEEYHLARGRSMVYERGNQQFYDYVANIAKGYDDK